MSLALNMNNITINILKSFAHTNPPIPVQRSPAVQNVCKMQEYIRKSSFEWYVSKNAINEIVYFVLGALGLVCGWCVLYLNVGGGVAWATAKDWVELYRSYFKTISATIDFPSGNTNKF